MITIILFITHVELLNILITIETNFLRPIDIYFRTQLLPLLVFLTHKRHLEHLEEGPYFGPILFMDARSKKPILTRPISRRSLNSHLKLSF